MIGRGALRDFTPRQSADSGGFPRCVLSEFFRPPYPARVSRRLILTTSPTSLQRRCSHHLPPVRSPRPCGRKTRAESAFLGVFALFTTSAGGVHTRGGDSQPSTSVRPRRFARPRRFSPLPALQVCFTPLPCPGFPFRGLSLRQSRTGSYPAEGLRDVATSAPAVARAVRRGLRLQGRTLCQSA